MSSIDADQQRKINCNVASGIFSGVRLLIENEEKVLELSGPDNIRKEDIVETYAGLRRQHAFFKG